MLVEQLTPSSAATEALVELTKTLMGEVLSHQDAIVRAIISGVSSSGLKKRYSAYLANDPTTTVLDLINQTSFELVPGDTVFIYKIQNQWSNAFIVAKQGASFETTSSLDAQNQATNEEEVSNQDAASTKLNTKLQDIYFIGSNESFDSNPGTTWGAIDVGTLCTLRFTNTELDVQAAWNYGQPFDGGRSLPYLKSLYQALQAVSVFFNNTPIEATIASMAGTNYSNLAFSCSGIFVFLQNKFFAHGGINSVVLIAQKSDVDSQLPAKFRVLGVCNSYSYSASS